MQKVVKIPFLGMNQDDPDANLKRGFYRRADNLLPPDTGSGYILENVPSTTLRNNASLPAGTNTCIGAFEDRTNNKIIYFIHNSNNNHGIWEFDPDDNSHTLILQSSVLDFSASNKIHSAGVIRTLLYWVDGDNIVRHIDKDNSPTGSIFDKKLALNKPYPRLPPTVSKQTDGTYTTNNISSDSWQICARIIYKNNEYSLLSPYSELIPAEQTPKSSDTTNNYIEVNITLDSEVLTEAEKIQFIYTKNNSGFFFIFNEQDIDSGDATYTVNFYNDKHPEALPSSDIMVSTNIPIRSGNLAIKDDKVFLTNDLDGYEDVGSFTLGLSITSSASATGETLHLPNTTYSYGVVFFDDYGKTNGVIQETKINIPNRFSETVNSAWPITRPLVTWTLSGTPPSWAKYYSIVRTPNITVENYFICVAQVLFYKRELGTSSRDVTEVLDDGKIYYENKQPSWSDPIYLKVPINLPAALDETWKCRILTDFNGGTLVEADITAIIGDKVILSDNLGITNWTSVRTLLDVMFYKPRVAPSFNYYEIGSTYLISDGAFTTTTDTHDGDQYCLSDWKQSFEPFEGGNFASGYQSVGWDDDAPIVTRNMYAPTPTMASNTIEQEVQSERLIEGKGKIGEIKLAKDFIKSLTTISDISKVYTPDYTKIASDIGRSFPVIKNKKQVEDYNSISFSNPYVSGTKINGTNRFDPLNSYSLVNDRTRIRKLVPVNASTVMLAISERNTTSLYIGDAFISTADGSELLTKTEGVLGKQGDRLLGGGYGTIHPESVVEHNGSVYWFDAHRGEVLRYNQAGVIPIGSLYKMRSYFKTKGEAYMSGGVVIGGFDPFLRIYYLTFTNDNETIGFADVDGQERWVSYFPYVPEYYCKANSRFFSFKNGKIYEHGITGGSYNSFHGASAVNSSVETVFNEEYSREKILRNISIESDSADWSVPECTDVAGQETELEKHHFKKTDNVFYANWLRDKNTNPLLLKAGQLAIRNGKEMRAKSFDITLENDSTEKVQLEAINIGYLDSPGHRIV